jgi:MraZ protein
MLLTGTFIRTLDDKQRFSLPKALREALGPVPDGVLFLAPGTDGSLALYPAEAFSQLAAQLGNDSPTGQDVRAFSRLFYAQAQRVEMDRQARIRIPVELARLADLERDIVLVGVRDHMEIWNRGRWEAYLLDKQARYDEIAERAFQRGASPPAASAERGEPAPKPKHPPQPR